MEHEWLIAICARRTTSDYLEAVYPNQSSVPANDRVYAYDPIGNRTQYAEGTADPLYYCANELNQYTATDDEPNTCPSPPTPTEVFSYDADGNLTADGSFAYTWDCENRLIGVEPAGMPRVGDKKLRFVYDYLGRRVRKLVYAWDPNAGDWSATPELDRRFVYYNWLPLVEYEGADNAKVRKYVWGLDLAGRGRNPERERGAAIDAAGGTLDRPAPRQGQVGGLIAMRDVTGGTNYFCFYDANGNLGQLVDRSAGSLDARYEYAPYGAVIGPDEDGDGDWRDDAGPYAEANPIRFSTKYFDDETGLGYWGYRYYSPRPGRWLSRDPIGEDGDEHLHRFTGNNPLNRTDSLGERSCWCCSPGEKCSARVEAEFVPARWLDPDKYDGTLVVVAVGELLNFVGDAPVCNPASPGPGELTAALGTLISNLRAQNTGSIWTRYQCAECVAHKQAAKRPWYFWLVAPDIRWYTCTRWKPLEKTRWARCKERFGRFQIGMHGLPDAVLKTLIKKCLEAAARDANAACGESWP